MIKLTTEIGPAAYQKLIADLNKNFEEAGNATALTERVTALEAQVADLTSRVEALELL